MHIKLPASIGLVSRSPRRRTRSPTISPPTRTSVHATSASGAASGTGSSLLTAAAGPLPRGVERGSEWGERGAQQVR
jgi:hypothetical protein